MIPVGETADLFLREGGAEGATGPGNSQANGPQGDWDSGKWRARECRPTDEVRSYRTESFRSPDRGGRERRSICVRDSVGDPIELTQAHASLRPAQGIGR